MTRYDIVLFDLDGTLLNTEEGILLSIRDTIRAFSLPEQPYEVLRTFIGPPIRESFVRVFGLDSETADACQAHFRHVYPEKNLFRALPFPGLQEALGRLKVSGARLGVATSKPGSYTLPLLEHFDLVDPFEVIQGAEPGRFEKKADVVRECLRRMETSDSSRVILVGDTGSDSRGAAQAGVDFLAVTFGFGYTDLDTPESAGAVALAHSCKEVADLLTGPAF